MSNAFQFGPLLLPFTLLLVFASAGSTLALGRWLSRQASAHVEQALWQLHAAQVDRPDIHFVFLNQAEDSGQVARWLGSRGDFRCAHSNTAARKRVMRNLVS